MMKCPCGTERLFDACCGALLEGREPARSAERLMRSRYCAYVVGDGRYLVETTHPDFRVEGDAPLIEVHARTTQWLGLEIVQVSEGSGRGEVEFRACYREGETPAIRVHHENSRFSLVEGQWYYENGTRYEASIGRNDPCPCGSGKKYKKCCML